MILSYRDKQT
jgi:antitoxin HigA-1